MGALTSRPQGFPFSARQRLVAHLWEAGLRANLARVESLVTNDIVRTISHFAALPRSPFEIAGAPRGRLDQSTAGIMGPPRAPDTRGEAMGRSGGWTGVAGWTRWSIACASAPVCSSKMSGLSA